MLLATSIIVLVMLSLGSVLLAAHAQDQPSANGSQNQSAQKPTEQKQGGEYSGFEETGPQAGPIPNKNANPTPQAPVSGLDVQEQNKTTATAAAQDAPVNNPGSPLGSGLIIGMGALAAGIVVAVSWYFKKRKSA
jgi:hypothetical protein